MADQRIRRIEGLEFEEKDRLFHYTSASGIIGILNTGCLWATHYRFLNDSREFQASRASLTAYLDKIVRIQLARLKFNRGVTLKPDLDKSVVARETAEYFVDIFHKAIWGSADGALRGLDGYVFSTFRSSPSDGMLFSDGGLLHWATYGANGGYAIEINPAKLEAILVAETERYPGIGWLSHPAVYDREGGEVPLELRKLFDEIGEAVHKYVEADALNQAVPRQITASIAPAMLAITCLLKDAYFRDEREARLVVFRLQASNEAGRTHEVSIRSSNGVPIPYIRLFEKSLLGETCPIERIIIGPHKDNERRFLGLTTYLRARNLEKIGVTISKVPFVSV